MSPTRREQIANLLIRFKAIPEVLDVPTWGPLLDALDTLCQPTPLRREQVEAVLRRYSLTLVQNWALNTHNRFVPESLIDDLLALGREEAKEWCAHLARRGTGWAFCLPDAELTAHYTTTWDQCPVRGCHAPRPTERP